MDFIKINKFSDFICFFFFGCFLSFFSVFKIKSYLLANAMSVCATALQTWQLQLYQY